MFDFLGLNISRNYWCYWKNTLYGISVSSASSDSRDAKFLSERSESVLEVKDG